MDRVVGVGVTRTASSFLLYIFFVFGVLILSPSLLSGQNPEARFPPDNQRSPEEVDQRLADLTRVEFGSVDSAREYQIGPEDLLEISVFEAPELNRAVRVSANGEIYLPLLEGVQAAGLTPRELEIVLQEFLRRRYMKDPHVSVYVKEMVSHPVSVFGAVAKPGVYQIRGTKTLLEVLSMAGGLAQDAGDTVIVMRGASFKPPPSASQGEGQDLRESVSNNPTRASSSSPSVQQASVEEATVEEAVRIDLKALLEEGDPRLNIPIHPGDIIKVTRAGIVYVVGSVNKPGGFVLKSNENISVLQAIAQAEGTTSTAAKGDTVIIRTAKDGSREEIPIDLGEILDGDEPDPMLQPNDILFVPNSVARTVAIRGIEAVVRTLSGLIIFGSR